MAGLQCAKCNGPVALSGSIFSDGVRCVQCATILRVPTWYSRLLLSLSYASGGVFLWLAGVRSLVAFCILWHPVSLSVLPLMLRLGMKVLPPKLVTGKPPKSFITLDLHGDEANRVPKV